MENICRAKCFADYFQLTIRILLNLLYEHLFLLIEHKSATRVSGYDFLHLAGVHLSFSVNDLIK